MHDDPKSVRKEIDKKDDIQEDDQKEEEEKEEEMIICIRKNRWDKKSNDENEEDESSSSEEEIPQINFSKDKLSKYLCPFTLNRSSLISIYECSIRKTKIVIHALIKFFIDNR